MVSVLLNRVSVVYIRNKFVIGHLHDSIVVSIPACHAGDRGSIPRRGVIFYLVKVLSKDKKIFYVLLVLLKSALELK